MVSIVAISGALLGALLLFPQLFGEFAAYQLGLFLIYGIAGQGIGFLWGKTGILPLGQAMFFGIAAYGCAHILNAGLAMLAQIIALIVVVLVLSLLAALFAMAIFRGKQDSGPFFSLSTLALAMLCEQIANTSPALTGGFNGLGISDAIGGLDPFGSFYYVIAGAVTICTFVLLMFDRLPFGLITKAVSQNEPRLQLLGFPTHWIKASAFFISVLFAGIAGTLFASHQLFVTPTSTGFALSAQLVIWTAVGGRFHPLGPLAGAVVIGWLTLELRDVFQYWEIVIALLFIIIVIKSPGGFVDLFARLIPAGLFPAKRKSPVQRDAPQIQLPEKAAPLVFKTTKLKIGPVEILNGVNFETPAAGIVAIIGPNGAGKTSLFNVISGTLKTTFGCILHDQRRIDNRAIHLGMRSGIGRKMQIPSVFSELTVQQNLAIATMAARSNIFDYFRFSTLSWITSIEKRLLDNRVLDLARLFEHRAGSLSQGHRQFLEFAMTTIPNPRLLLLDEPCAGLSHGETELMTGLVSDYQQNTGALILLIEHD
ncbi:MAG: ATP-binding cassette domain-containing protein, partial [Cohaesibacteraceae bacterium]|nr:ATP-binding cassette domain-containing protein [Cohaesibacteraceae bacterium]